MKLKSLLMTAIAVLSLASCKDEDRPEIILPSKAYALIAGIGGEDKVTMNCQGEWAITTEKDSWITVTPTSGTGTAIITFSAKENTTDKERTQYVSINSQQFKVIQTINLRIDNVIGVWSTKAKDYIFTFREDGTCKSEMTKGGTFEGNYTITGNIIKIVTIMGGNEKIVEVTVNAMSATTMKASVMGTELNLTKE